MQRYQITSQRELRKAFFSMCSECASESCTFAMHGKVRSRFNLDANMCFNDWKDSMHRDGVISDRLAFSATLF